MNPAEYIDLLEKRFERYFSVEREAGLLGKNFDLFARHRSDSVRTLLSQKDVIDGFWEEELIFVKVIERVTRDTLREIAAMFVEAAEKLVTPDREHKSSELTAILVAQDGLDPDAVRDVKRFRWSRPYKFYFHGVADARILVADCSSETLTASPLAKRSLRAFAMRPT